MMGMGAGSALSSGGRKLMQLAIMGGVGVTALGAYGYSLPQNPEANAAMQFIQGNRALIIAVGVGAIVLGAMLSWSSRQRMMKKMMGGIPGMGAGGTMGIGGMGMGGMPPGGLPPGMAELMARGSAAPPPAVKVRCRSCKSLEEEAATFCSKCGKPMAEIPA